MRICTASLVKNCCSWGAEIGQWAEWNHDTSLEWHLLEYPPHQGLRRLVEDLNRVYRDQPALHQRDFDWNGFEWIDCNDALNSTLSMIRLGDSPEDTLIAAFNFTPVPRQDYRLGAPEGGYWAEIFNSDAEIYGGSGWGNLGGQTAESYSVHGRPYSLTITLPPLAAVFFKRS